MPSEQKWPAQASIKSCCAALYESDWAKLLLGGSFHPGGVHLTKRLGEMLGLGRGSRVLDVASGNGTTAMFLAETFGCEVIGIDYSERNVKEASRQAQAEGLGTRIKFEQGDAEALPKGDASVDAVICECSFCTFPNKAAASREFFRVLVPGGRVGISDVTRHGPLPHELVGMLSWLACFGDAKDTNEYQQLLTSAGFVVDGTEDHREALVEMVEQVRMKLLGGEVLAGLKKVPLPRVDIQQAKDLATAALAAIRQDKLGYILMVATKPT